MQKRQVLKTGFGLLCIALLLAVYLFPARGTIQAFNQRNLVRAAEVQDVDGKLIYRRLAPVSDMLP